MNVYKNLLTKVKYLLATEKDLEIEERKSFQWQLLTSVPNFTEFNFICGKGGANTLFFCMSSLKDDRELALPDDGIKLLTKLSNSKFFCFNVYDKNKDLLASFVLEDDAKSIENKKAAFIVGVKFNGKKKLLHKKTPGLFNKTSWSEV